MRRFTTISVSLILVLLLGGTAFASGQFGATDLMNTAKSGTLAEGSMDLYANYDQGAAIFGLDAGLTARLEAGVTVVSVPGWQAADLRIKYHLLLEKQDGLGLAIGVADIGDAVVSPYIVAGKTLAKGLEGYLGVGGGQFGGVFFGLSKSLATTYGSTLFVEYDSYGLNLGGRFNIARNLSLNVGVSNLEDVVLGMSYVARF